MPESRPATMCILTKSFLGENRCFSRDTAHIACMVTECDHGR